MSEWVRKTIYQTELKSDILTIDELYELTLDILNPRIKSNEHAIAKLNNGLTIQIDKKSNAVELTADITNAILPKDDAIHYLNDILQSLKQHVSFTEKVKRSLKILKFVQSNALFD